MEKKLELFARRYRAALKNHLQPRKGVDSNLALEVGRQAVTLGLDTLALAKIHDLSLAKILAAANSTSQKELLIKRAELFFHKANTCIEETHLAARQTRSQLDEVMKTLVRRTTELAVSNQALRQGAARQKVMAEDFGRRGRNYEKRLREALDLQRRLRRLTHQLLAAQEDERQKISRELSSEIAQTLLGINIRLLSLKQEARTNSTGLKKQITLTQRLVASSAKSVRDAGRKT